MQMSEGLKVYETWREPKTKRDCVAHSQRRRLPSTMGMSRAFERDLESLVDILFLRYAGGMKKWLPLLVGVLAVGCAPKPDPVDPVSGPPAKPSAGAGTQAAGGGGGIAPIGSGAATGMTPVTGAENVGGGGMGGVSQAAKNQARNAAANAGQGSLGGTTGDADGE